MCNLSYHLSYITHPHKTGFNVFLEDITTELKLLKHKLQLPYLGHKFSITTLPSDSSDDEIPDLVSIDESESPKDNDYVPVPFG